MKVAAIHRPSAATLSIIGRKVYDPAIREVLTSGGAESIGICQGTVLEIIVASDIAEKTGRRDGRGAERQLSPAYDLSGGCR